MADFKSIDECEKQNLVDTAPPLQPAVREPLSFRKRLAGHAASYVLLLLSLSLLLRQWASCPSAHEERLQSAVPMDYPSYMYGDEFWKGKNVTKVALEAHIMSKCPDAAYCLQELVVPAMAKVSNKVDFKLSYIGSIEPKSEDVKCMHGPSECLGNIIELCAADEYPSPIIYLGFANCLSADYSDIPKRPLIESCALEHGIEIDKVNACISDEGRGIGLLRDSVKRSQSVKVSTSCTVRVEENVWCVRDGGEWKDCENGHSIRDLVSEIELLYVMKNIDKGGDHDHDHDYEE